MVSTALLLSRLKTLPTLLLRLSSHRAICLEHLNWRSLQLALLALAFGGLQVWWIRSALSKRDLTPPLSDWAFRKNLERIWANRAPQR